MTFFFEISAVVLGSIALLVYGLDTFYWLIKDLEEAEKDKKEEEEDEKVKENIIKTMYS